MHNISENIFVTNAKNLFLIYLHNACVNLSILCACPTCSPRQDSNPAPHYCDLLTAWPNLCWKKTPAPTFLSPLLQTPVKRAPGSKVYSWEAACQRLGSSVKSNVGIIHCATLWSSANDFPIMIPTFTHIFADYTDYTDYAFLASPWICISLLLTLAHKGVANGLDKLSDQCSHT